VRELNYQVVYFLLILFDSAQIEFERFAVVRELQLDVGRVLVLKSNVLVQLLIRTINYQKRQKRKLKKKVNYVD